MRRLIISDLHLGDPRINKDRLLLRILRDQQYDELILAGDVIDLWAEKDWYKIANNHSVLIESIRGISDAKKVVWVVGNHEQLPWDNPIHAARFFLPKAYFLEEYYFFDAHRFCVTHGQYMEHTSEALLRFMCKLKLLVWRLTKLDLQAFFGHIGGFYKRKMNKLQDAYSKTYTDTCDCLILGHTHIPLMGGASPQYVNCGDWVEHTSYVLVDNGEVELCLE